MAPEPGLPSQPDEPPIDSDRNDEAYQLAEKILEATGWDPAAIAGRLDYHRRKGRGA